MDSKRRQHDGQSTSTRSRSQSQQEGRKGGLRIRRPEDQEGEALGRSRGGLTSKIHLAVDGRGLPLSIVVTPGQRHDGTQLQAVLDGIRVPRGGRGRPRKRPEHVVGDKGYNYPRCGQLLRNRGIAHTIPERSDQRQRRATRYDERALNYRTGVLIASLILRLAA